MIPSSFDREAHRARRARFIAQLGAVRALIPAGGPSPRNYPAAVYPFRPTSHFLYLIGLRAPGAFAWFADGECTLYLPEPADDIALWEGALPSRDQIAELTGCSVRDIGELPSLLPAAPVGALWAIDLATRLRHESWLLRTADEGLTDADATVADAIIQLRLRHDEAAQAGLRRAAEATAAAHYAGLGRTRLGILEAEVRAAMESEILARDMTTAYAPIVTIHGEVLHNEHHHHTLKPGDLLLADVGAETDGGWAGDVTRTWPVSGRFSTTQREIYDVVLAAQLAALEAARPGVSYRDVHLTAARQMTVGLVELGILRGDIDELVADGIHALFFPHGVGHLLGLDVHDMEDLGDRASYAPGRVRDHQFGLAYLRLNRDLEPGMAVTIEPGFYQVPAILEDPTRRAQAGDRVDWDRLRVFHDVRGIRIEDDVLITATGNDVLSRSIPKLAEEIESAVGEPA